MRRPPPDDDATVLRRPLPPRRPARRRGLLAAGLAGGIAAAAGVATSLLRRPVRPSPPAPAPPAIPISLADEAAIRAHVAERLTVFRFAPAPAVVVLDFPTLAMQGAMLNRVAALVEKAGLPRDRVLDDAALAAAIRASGDTPETYYFGHDYAAAALARFFALADAGRIALNPAEEWLRALLRQLGWFAPGAVGALITLTRVPQQAVAALDAAARATILHHELSHGLFFTSAAYATYVQRFWDTALSDDERSALRRFLAAQGYDVADSELVRNEMQAYLLFTPDPRFCRAADLGMTPARRGALAAAFLRDMPPGWLRDSLATGMAALR
jgi:hypothetical protein